VQPTKSAALNLRLIKVTSFNWQLSCFKIRRRSRTDTMDTLLYLCLRSEQEANTRDLPSKYSGKVGRVGGCGSLREGKGRRMYLDGQLYTRPWLFQPYGVQPWL
jgi:hypothetical protein